ncbi:hypothetical protein NUW54_g10320 [Trametes sanguinea]|uniref:Uncharacterized protein n=1 Tax=Trametes sanguinea TaxID=158606 RepID=A0ACC1NZX1_9APHY|nr:hypothetical protein NUW54_g10320 [Trametes sanguinea]
MKRYRTNRLARQIMATLPEDDIESLGTSCDCSSITMSSDTEDIPAVPLAARSRPMASDRASTTVPATSGAISQKRAAHSALDDSEVGEDEAPKRLKCVDDTDEASDGDEENAKNEQSDGSEQIQEDDGSDEYQEDEDDASGDENGDVERFLEVTHQHL